MKIIKIYVTQYKGINEHGDLVTFAGNNIYAESIEEAERLAPETHEVIGQLVCEIPCIEGTYDPDWSKRIDYDTLENLNNDIYSS